MISRYTVVLAIFCALIFSAPLSAQRRDPLTDKESDELRELAQEPLKRLKLLIKFATERLDNVERMRVEPKVADRGKKIHDALEDFRQIVDELDDNIDDYSQKQSDIRKVLNEVVSAETNFDMRLKDFKETGESPKHMDEYKLYSYALEDAIESINLSLSDAKKTLDEQNAALSTAKKK